MIEDDSLFLYHLTLRHGTPGIHSVLGNFSGASKKAQELVVAHSTSLQIFRPDANTGKLATLGPAHEPVLATISKIEKVRAAGGFRDLLVITGDSGKLSILEFNSTTNQFQPLVQLAYGKNGLNRLSQGTYLAVDPSNRAICISALEKNKLVFKVSSTQDESVELSSPLEAVSRDIITLSLVALDTEFDNPMFAAIECDHSEYSRKVYDPNTSPLKLNYYELDQGLNHIVKKKSVDTVPASSNHLIPLPGHIRGLFVCSGDETNGSYLIYDNPANTSRLYIPLPVREGTSTTTIITHVTHKLKKNNFFVLLQSTLGDLFKAEVDYDEDKELIKDITVKYFDTIPVSTSLNVFKSGFLYANVTNNDKHFYQFEKLGDEDDGSTLQMTTSQDDFTDVSSRKFSPRPLENLALIDIVDNLCPIIQSDLVDINNSRKLVTLTSNSYLKTLTQGIPTNLIVSSPLPMLPSEIFTTKLTSASANDEYLILSSSLESKTLVLSIGEVVEEVEDSNFVTTQPTIAVQQVGKTSIVQIYSNGIRHIRQVEDKKVTSDWFPPAGIQIKHASTNNEQVLIGLSNSELFYFEIDQFDDQLIEYQERLEISSPITSLAISPSSESERKSSFAIVGCEDETVQVVSLQIHNCLEILSLQALSSKSVALIMLKAQGSRNVTYVHIGMENGLYVRTTIDEVTGTLSDTRIKYLGNQPVKLASINNSSALLAISSSPWIGYDTSSQSEDFKLTPLLNSNITRGTSFVSEDIGGEGIVGLSGSDLVIFSVGDEESGFDPTKDFNIDKLKLRYSPRKMIVDKDEKLATTTIYVAESEYGIKGPYESDLNNSEDVQNEFGHKRVKFSWGSCVQVIDLGSDEVTQTVEFSSNESILSIEKIRFSKGQEHLVVGISTDQKLLPSSYDKNYIYTFKILKKKGLPNKLQLLHKTELDFQPTAMLAFNGKLLVGMKNYLRLFDLGQKQLLRKTSTKIDYIASIHKLGFQGDNRVVICDSASSTIFVKYDTTENRFIPFVDDIMKRQVTALGSLDYDTIVGGDKFGNLWVSRVPKDVSAQSDDDWTILKGQDSYLNASSSRLQPVCEFFLSDIPTSFIKGSLMTGGQESIFYSGLQGSIGLLLPLATKQEVDFLVKLELELRKQFDSNSISGADTKAYNLLGKDHLKFRSYYNPVKNVVDGDLIEKYYNLSQAAKIKVASSLDRTPKEVEKKIFDLRNRSAF